MPCETPDESHGSSRFSRTPEPCRAKTKLDVRTNKKASFKLRTNVEKVG